MIDALNLKPWQTKDTQSDKQRTFNKKSTKVQLMLILKQSTNYTQF